MTTESFSSTADEKGSASSSQRAADVTIALVTHNASADLPECLSAVARLEHPRLEVVVVDCASTDGSAGVARRCGPPNLPLRVFEPGCNLGFAGGMNLALRETQASFVLSLNADARPAPDFVGRLLRRFEGPSGARVAAATGRLLRMRPAGEAAVLDACGMRLTLTWRHLDRGSGSPDRGQWSSPEEVFGATGAACLLRREALEDVAVEGEVFASEFHTFREDAELSFRLRERGWKVVYEPAATAWHRRRNLPGRRSEMTAEVNRNTLKNRYLLRAYHQTSLNFLFTLLPTAVRDLAALAYVLSRERDSLSSYAWLWRNRRWIWRRRRAIQGRRTEPAWKIDRWFFRRGIPL